MPKRSSKSEDDANSLAFQIVATATEMKAVLKPSQKRQKNKAAVALGRLGGQKGGKARAESLTPEKRSEIAKKAARARWDKSKKKA